MCSDKISSEEWIENVCVEIIFLISKVYYATISKK